MSDYSSVNKTAWFIQKMMSGWFSRTEIVDLAAAEFPSIARKTLDGTIGQYWSDSVNPKWGTYLGLPEPLGCWPSCFPRTSERSTSSLCMHSRKFQTRLAFPARDQLSADDDAALGKSDFLADLHHPVPARALDGRTDELGADVAFAKVFLVD